MAEIVVLLIVVFAIAGSVGFKFYRSSAWSYVDVVYYPLAAIGVVLLFANNLTEMRLFELGQLADTEKAELKVINSAKPDVRVMTSGELVDSSFSLIKTISEFGAICRDIPKMDPRCVVAQKLETSISNFLKATQAQYESPELRLSGSCSAAEVLLDEIRTKEEISSFIGDELITQYKTAASKNYHPLAYDSIALEAKAFEQRALGRIEWLRDAMLKEDSESTRWVLSVFRSEVDFGKTILQGLYPCIVAPKKELDLLTKWTSSRRSKEEYIHQIEQDRKNTQELPSGASLLLWIQLNLWPIVLIIALSLKFAKGTAALRKANSAES